MAANSKILLNQWRTEQGSCYWLGCYLAFTKNGQEPTLSENQLTITKNTLKTSIPAHVHREWYYLINSKELGLFPPWCVRESSPRM